MHIPDAFLLIERQLRMMDKLMKNQQQNLSGGDLPDNNKPLLNIY